MKNKGFSLIEVLIAMSILTVGILAVVSMQTMSIKVQSRSKISATIQLKTQQIIERISANAKDDASILSYSNLNTKNTAPADEPAKSDHAYFKNLLSDIPQGYAEVLVLNQRPYPLSVKVYWKDGDIGHKMEFSTYILPH